MMHTTARADRNELSAKKALCRSKLHGIYRMGIVLSYGQQVYFDGYSGPPITMPAKKKTKKTAHTHVSMYACTHTHIHKGRERPSTYTEQQLTRGKLNMLAYYRVEKYHLQIILEQVLQLHTGGVGQSVLDCLDHSKVCNSYTRA